MTESYLLQNKKLHYHGCVTTELKESTQKESTIKDDSVDSISVNSNTQENKNAYDDLTHYTETNSIDRGKNKKIDNYLGYHLKKKEINLNKEMNKVSMSKNINDQKEALLKNKIYE